MARKATSKATGKGTAVQQMPQAKRGEVVERPGSVRGGQPGPTHEQIAQRAQDIWKRHGCPPGEDRENWFEAEAELKREMGIR